MYLSSSNTGEGPPELCSSQEGPAVNVYRTSAITAIAGWLPLDTDSRLAPPCCQTCDLTAPTMHCSLGKPQHSEWRCVTWMGHITVRAGTWARTSVCWRCPLLVMANTTVLYLSQSLKKDTRRDEGGGHELSGSLPRRAEIDGEIKEVGLPRLSTLLWGFTSSPLAFFLFNIEVLSKV